jgi:hypothetical protein
MTARIRLIYEKRGGACFVPHVALATVFARAARRAGIELSSTDGFSPHSKMSFGPELPAGVVALHEPVDLWVKADVEKGMECEKASEWMSLLNAQMPEGFRVKRLIFLPEGAGVLGKDCKAAHYWIRARNEPPVSELLDHLKNHFGEDVLFADILNANISVVLGNPAQNGIGGWVKALTAMEKISGWQDLCIVRRALGRWERDEEKMVTLTEDDTACPQEER